MKKNLRLNIDAPCGENWEAMTPSGNGRFCGSCSKTVVDFSTMTDREILEVLSRTGKHACGRFTADQLGRNILPEKSHKPRPVWYFLLSAILMTTRVQAQTRPPRAESAYIAQKHMEHAAPAADPLTITCTVLDSITGRPVTGVSVKIPHTNHGVATDSEGRVLLSGEMAREGVVLEISCVSYTTRQITIGGDMVQQGRLAVNLAPLFSELQPVVVCNTSRKVMGAFSIIRRMTIWKDTAQKLVKDTLSLLGVCRDPLVIFPNPALRGSTVRLSMRSQPAGVYRVELFSMAGALVQVNEMEMGDDVSSVLMIPSSLSAGMYIVRVCLPEGKKGYTRKLVVL